MKEPYKSLLFIAVMTSIIIFSFYLGTLYPFQINSLTGNDNEITNCSNLSLEDTANCLNRELNKFYIYNESNINKTLNFTEFEQQGGVCHHATEWFNAKATELGFYSKRIDFWINQTKVGHTISLIADKTGYCILDQKTYHCWRTG